MINGKADDVIEFFFESLLNSYQIGLKTSRRVNDFIFDCVHKCNKNFLNEVDHMKILQIG